VRNRDRRKSHRRFIKSLIIFHQTALNLKKSWIGTRESAASPRSKRIITKLLLRGMQR